MVFKLLTAAKISWRPVWVGAITTSVLFAVGKYLIGLYLTHSGTASIYGAAGSLVVFIFWVYYSAQVSITAPRSLMPMPDIMRKPILKLCP